MGVFGIEIILTFLLIGWLRSKRRGRVEPWPFMLSMLFYGTVTAAISAYIEIKYSFDLQRLAESSPELVRLYGAQLALINNLAASLIEELAKYAIGVFTVISSKHFHKMSDSILYLILIGLGFSLIEDAIFLLNPHAAASYRLMSFYVHSGTSAIIGYSMGRFKFGLAGYRELGRAVFKAILLHFAYNFSTTLPHPQFSFWLTLLITIYISLQIFILYRNAIKDEYTLLHKNRRRQGQRLLNLDPSA